MGKMITITEAAKLTGVSQQAVRQWIQRNKIKGEKRTVKGIKKIWYVDEDEVKNLVGMD